MQQALNSDDPTVAVFDIGKTNIKLSAATTNGELAETISLANPTLPGPPWRHHDLARVAHWMLESLEILSRRFPLQTLVPIAHGAAGVLVGDDPDNHNGVVLPMIDYEQDLPASIREDYAAIAGSFHDRGSTILLQAAHQARQLYWMQQEAPAALDSASWYLCLPQYWAWYLSGVAASEYTMLAAQSHLWNVVEQRWSPIVESQGWEHLMPPFAPAWQKLGKIRKSLSDQYDINPELDVLTGGHDSSVNLYRYLAAGQSDVCVVSTGTWIAGLCTETPIEKIDEQRGMVINSDVAGRPVGGALTMGGREFSLVAGDADEPADGSVCEQLIARNTMALPSFGDDDGLFPGSARRGHIIGPAPQTVVERKTLAVLYSALLTLECIDALSANGTVILDGTFLRDPLYASLLSALRPGAETQFNLDSYGIVAGAALLASHEQRRSPAPITLTHPQPYDGDVNALRDYADRWKQRSNS